MKDTCQDCGKTYPLLSYGRCAECRKAMDTCGVCGDDLHLHFPANKRDHMFRPSRGGTS
jgi:rRNA maturation protein Nop10